MNTSLPPNAEVNSLRNSILMNGFGQHWLHSTFLTLRSSQWSVDEFEKACLEKPGLRQRVAYGYVAQRFIEKPVSQPVEQYKGLRFLI